MKKNKTLESNSKIRKSLVKDLPQIIEIQEAVTKSKVGPKRKAILKEHIQKEGDISLVALVNGKVTGYVIGEVMTDSFGIDQGGWIENSVVHPKHMGGGIGQTLTIHLFEDYKERKILEIYTAVR